jgi:hypothetical protein
MLTWMLYFVKSQLNNLRSPSIQKGTKQGTRKQKERETNCISSIGKIFHIFYANAEKVTKFSKILSFFARSLDMIVNQVQ